jgi:hypothetical protein
MILKVYLCKFYYIFFLFLADSKNTTKDEVEKDPDAQPVEIRAQQVCYMFMYVYLCFLFLF